MVSEIPNNRLGRLIRRMKIVGSLMAACMLVMSYNQSVLAETVDIEPKSVNSLEQPVVTSEPDDPVVQFNLGKQYDKGEGRPQDKAAARKWYRQAAEQGYAEAQLLLGIIYDQGIGVDRDFAQAIDWYRRAAEQGYAKAQYNLAAMYDEGLGVRQDYQQAAAWYRKAAEQNYAKAQFNLGSMYFKGEGVPQDNVEAAMWLNLAAAQGYDKEVKVRLALEKSLTATQSKKAKKRAKEWKSSLNRSRQSH